MTNETKRSRMTEAEDRYFRRLRARLAKGQKPKLRVLYPGVEEVLAEYGYTVEECYVTTGIKADDHKEYMREWRKLRKERNKDGE